MRRTAVATITATAAGALLAALPAAPPALAANASAAASAPSVASSCAGVGMSAKVSTWKDLGLPVLGWLENLGFDGHGGMWVSELEMNKLVRFDASGTAGATLTVADPGASLLGPDGRMYVNYGDFTAAALTGGGGVERFDPTASAPVLAPFATVPGMANGAAFDDQGDLYVADTVSGDVDEFTPDGKAVPSFAAAAKIPGADGLVFADGYLYVTELTDTASSIVQIPVTDPSAHTTLISLSSGGVPLKLPDDLAVGPDGALYVATATGQLIRVDRSTGQGCVLASPGLPLTSIRFPIGFGSYAPATDAFATSEGGEILHVSITGLRPTAAQPTPASHQPTRRKKRRHRKHTPAKRRHHRS